MKIEQRTINASMIILLFFLMVQQTFRIFSLNIGLHSEIIIDLKFFIILMALAFSVLTILHLLIAVCIIKWNIHICLYIPIKESYSFNIYELRSFIMVEKTYQRLEVIRC